MRSSLSRWKLTLLKYVQIRCSRLVDISCRRGELMCAIAYVFSSLTPKETFKQCYSYECAIYESIGCKGLTLKYSKDRTEIL